MNDEEKYNRIRAMGLKPTYESVHEGSRRGAGVCRECNRRTTLVRLTYCARCGSSRGLVAE